MSVVLRLDVASSTVFEIEVASRSLKPGNRVNMTLLIEPRAYIWNIAVMKHNTLFS